MELSSRPIRRSIWCFINALYEVVQYVMFVWITIGQACQNLVSKHSVPTTDDYGFTVVSNHATRLHKVPGHMAVIMSDGAASVGDLAKIVVWCAAAGISCVTFYDYTGILKVIDTQLCSALNKMERVGGLCLKKIIWGNKTLPSDITIKHGNGTNGYKMQNVCVNMFSLSDSKESLVDAANSLRTLIESETTDIDVELVTSVLQKSLNIPEVDLAVCCGKTFCTYGFLPWHTRLTEFKQLPSHHNIEVTYFISLLDSYSKCQQRFGK